MVFYQRIGMVTLRTDRFEDRVVFAGNLEKNDLSIKLSDIQMYDMGIYTCYVMNSPDRIPGYGAIQLNVVTERKMLTLYLLHPLIIFTIYPIRVKGCGESQSQLTLGERWGTPWTGHQCITGLTEAVIRHELWKMFRHNFSGDFQEFAFHIWRTNQEMVHIKRFDNNRKIQARGGTCDEHAGLHHIDTASPYHPLYLGCLLETFPFSILRYL